VTAEGGVPLADVRVSVNGTQLGAMSTADGRFAIAGLSAGTYTVRAQRIGYAPQTRDVTVIAGQGGTANFQLQAVATALSEVVSVGYTTQSRATVSDAVATVSAADIADQKVTTIEDALHGRVAGVQVTTSGEPGRAAQISVRGQSFLGNVSPLYVVDGMYLSENTNIDPQDIESIEVLKGPAAATLYGADAAGGVIQILTKKGKRGQQQMRWNGRAEIGSNTWGVDDLTNYTMCTPARKAAVDAAGVPTWSRCQGVADSAVISDQPFVRDHNAMRDGGVQNISTSVTGGGDRYQFYIAFDKIHEEGILRNSNDDRRSIRTNVGFNPNNVLDFNVNLSYGRRDFACRSATKQRTDCCSPARAAFRVFRRRRPTRCDMAGRRSTRSTRTSTTTRRRRIVSSSGRRRTGIRSRGFTIG
jgi:TonB-dependent SusC/RagA subfamily outer membrane receptor